MTDKPKNLGGCPSRYTPELAQSICEAVATLPFGIEKICKMYAHFPDRSTIRLWRLTNPEFAAKYTEAKRIQSDIMIEDMEDLTAALNEHKFRDDKGTLRLDSGLVSHAKLITECRKWVAARLLPKIYGDHKQVEDLQADNDKIKAELAALKAELDAKNKKDF